MPDGVWVDVEDRLPEFGRWVKVWGNFCSDGYPAPKAYRRLESPGRPYWLWCSPEWRGSCGIFWWWDAPTEPPPAPGWRPLAGPGDAGYA